MGEHVSTCTANCSSTEYILHKIHKIIYFVAKSGLTKLEALYMCLNYKYFKDNKMKRIHFINVLYIIHLHFLAQEGVLRRRA